MAYIDKTYYHENFGNSIIDDNEFLRLADISSEVIYEICLCKPTEAHLVSNDFKKAVAYQVEMLHAQGGVDAILGFSESSNTISSESLGDYSYSVNSSNSQSIRTVNGIPVSSMSIMLLRKLGLMSRWAYAEYYSEMEKRNGT